MKKLLIFLSLITLIGCGKADKNSSVIEDTESKETDAGEKNDTKAETVKKVNGCDEATFAIKPESTEIMGLNKVSATTIEFEVDRNGTKEKRVAEVWYPAMPGSEKDKEKVVYDIREQLAPEEGAKIPDEDNPWHYCDCYRDLPVDEAFGPYPIVIFVHGTAAFRHQSLSQMVHYASRGFVVAAVDHPGLKLGDLLGLNFSSTLELDVKTLIGLFQNDSESLSFLKGKYDNKRFATVGHSRGGGVAAAFSDIAEVIIPMAAGGTKEGLALKNTLILGGIDDQVARYQGQQSGYENSKGEKRLIGIKNAGHLAFSDLCLLGGDKGNLVDIAKKYKVSNAQFADRLWDGCAEGQIDPLKAIEITNYVTTAVLEEQLQCQEGQISKTFPVVLSKYPEVGEYQETLE